ncbi:MAG: hypothetical protein ABSA47_10845 [Verrucomicrobiota bacterium]
MQDENWFVVERRVAPRPPALETQQTARRGRIGRMRRIAERSRSVGVVFEGHGAKLEQITEARWNKLRKRTNGASQRCEESRLTDFWMAWETFET